MSASVGWGVLGVLSGGLLNGSWVLPMKRLRAWRWENTWLVYSVGGLTVLPWAAALMTVPHLNDAFNRTSELSLVKILVFGFGWGIGSVLFGLGVSRLGLAVGYGVILGLIAPIGTFLPLVVLHPERLWTRQGQALIAGTLMAVTGIVLLAIAGRRREGEAKPLTPMVQSGFLIGMTICILSGIFSPMLNFSFVFGQDLQQQALVLGARPSMAANAIWALALSAGFVANAGYCVYLLQRNHSWHLFALSKSPASYWIGACLMGVICFGSFLLYGIGATTLGPLGGIVGWPLFVSMSLITSNFWGALTGEWRGASRRSYGYSLLGIAFLIVAVAIISRAGNS
ncbi:MAG: L-rhamnose/proton symporter RhaT [Terriglobia bacterium]|jgi:L-rhamnose-H+ transport protein